MTNLPRIFLIITLAASLCACGGDKKPSDDPAKDNPGDVVEEKTPEYTFTADKGWDIYTAGTYRYGPSIIINDDGSIDAWFAAPGSNFAADNSWKLYKDQDEANFPINLAATTVGLAFTVGEPIYSISASCPTWGTNGTESLLMSLYKWDTDYQKTVSGSPVIARKVTGMKDNAWNQIVKGDGSKFEAGRYLLTLTEGSANAGVWSAKEAADGMEVQTYTNGSPTTGSLLVLVAPDESGSSTGTYWDQISYQHSKDGGKTWTQEEMVLKPTEGTRDEFSCCDPGVIKIGEYYYLGYTSTENPAGVENHLYMSRGKTPRGPWEKWNGQGWGGDKVEPIVTFTGSKEKWGAGEPSMVVVNGTLYLYYTWDDDFLGTRVSTVAADDPLWPAHLQFRGTAVNKNGISGADHCDVKYCDAMERFVAVHTAKRMTSASYIQIWTSKDGLTFEKQRELTGSLGGGLHNIGISGDALGHIDINKSQFIGYAYGLDANGNSTWAKWSTRWNPLTIKKL